MMTGNTGSLILDIQRFCTYDGPGVRTTVFFKGCNMRCAWCHNPESFSREPELLFYEEKCVHCKACMEICPNQAHVWENETHMVLREKCTGCGQCVEACLSGALEISGKKMSVEEIMQSIEKDAKYYKATDGGVTFSGGEASLHFDMLKELLKKCRENGYHTALETNGFVAADRLRELIPLVNLFLLDCKHTDEQAHKKWTGVSLEPVRNTLKLLNVSGSKVILRCPIIPGVNDYEAHFEKIRELHETYPCIVQIEIMAYHDIGKGKWKALGKEYGLAELKSVTAEQKQEWELRCLNTFESISHEENR